ncbi:MAG: hypothetical protein LBG99_02590 [Propionibacteriaceae bacterium]|nr:hypothetical protein [Propionibacteriaceae bacterium]
MSTDTTFYYRQPTISTLAVLQDGNHWDEAVDTALLSHSQTAQIPGTQILNPAILMAFKAI